MLHRLVTLLLLTAFPAAAAAQPVEITPRFKAGDEFRLDFTRERQTPRVTNISSRTTVTIRVLSTGPEGTELEWVQGDTQFSDPQVAKNPIVGAALDAARGLSFRLGLDADGRFVRLVNDEEVLGKLQALADNLIAQVAAIMPEAQRADLTATMRQVLSPTLLRSSATRDIEMYFALNGTRFLAGEMVEVESEVANPFGSDPLPATLRIRLDSATADTASLTATTVFGPDAIRAVTATFAQQAGKPIPADALATLPPSPTLPLCLSSITPSRTRHARFATSMEWSASNGNSSARRCHHLQVPPLQPDVAGAG
jgi:hypothetical protein